MKRILIWVMATLTTVLATYSCHTAEYHLDKYLDKGGVIKPKTDTMKVEVKINGKDSTIFVPVNCPEIKIPKSKTEIRQEEKTRRNKDNNNRKITIKKLETELKKVKSDNDRLKKEAEENRKLKIKESNNQKKVDVVKERQEGKTNRNVSFWIVACIVSCIFGRIVLPLIEKNLLKLIFKV